MTAVPAGEHFTRCYGELRRLAHARLRESGRANFLNTTALVNESYLRLANRVELAFSGRPEFFAYASRTMRSVIVDLSRQMLAQRAGGGVEHIALTTELGEQIPADERDVLEIHQALEKLEAVDQRMARVVEMLYFGGLTQVETAEALGVDERTVRRDWEQARLILAAALR